VASFFISRVDTVVDQYLTELSKQATAAGNPELAERAKALRGQAAIANAQLAYAAHQQLLATARGQALAARGARPQRPLWASAGVKDPGYDDTRYVLDLAAARRRRPRRVPRRHDYRHRAAAPGRPGRARHRQGRLRWRRRRPGTEGCTQLRGSLEHPDRGTTSQLTAAGATVRPDGSTALAGDGPAAAAPTPPPTPPTHDRTSPPAQEQQPMTAPTPNPTSPDVDTDAVGRDQHRQDSTDRDLDAPPLITDEAAQNDDPVIKPGNS
jgi:hypothetical protein